VIFDTINSTNKGQWGKFMKSMVGIDLYSAESWVVPFAKLWINRNVTLITSLTVDIIKKVEVEITNGLLSGKSVRTIAKGLYDEGGLLSGQKARARLIARDQVSKINGNMTQKRQQDGGIELYVWRTSGDERVRASHSAHEGTIYSWSNPPEGTGAPGEDYQCRCHAEPIMVFDLSEKDIDNLVGKKYSPDLITA
jgi:SPP1 gp7 family putative phage head morphogenesis protein